MEFMMRLIMWLSLFTLVGAADIKANEISEVAEMPEIVITGQRNPQTFDYADGLKVIERFESLPAEQRSHVQLKFYVEPKRKADLTAPIDTLEMAIHAGDEFLPIKVAPSGELSIPRLAPEMAKRAVLMSTLPRRSLKVVYKIDLSVPQIAPLDAGWLRTAIGQAKGAWKAVLPRMARKTVPTFKCVEFQVLGPAEVSFAELNQPDLWSASATPGAPVKWPQASEVPDSAQVTLTGGPLRRLAACKQ